MNKLRKSKIVAWIALAFILFVLVLSFNMRQAWWTFIDIFFAFMMVFSHLVALYIDKFNSYSSRQLDKVAFICGILMLVAFIGEYIAESVIYRL